MYHYRLSFICEYFYYAGILSLYVINSVYFFLIVFEVMLRKTLPYLQSICIFLHRYFSLFLNEQISLFAFNSLTQADFFGMQVSSWCLQSEQFKHIARKKRNL